MIFVCNLLFGTIDQTILPALIDLDYDLVSTTGQTSVLFLTPKTSVNRESYFISLGFLTVTEGPGEIRILLVNIMSGDDLCFNNSSILMLIVVFDSRCV